MNFQTLAFLGVVVFTLVVVAVVVYLKRRGVLRTAANAATAAVVTDAEKIVAKVDPTPPVPPVAK